MALAGLLVGLPIGINRSSGPEVYDIDKRDWRTPRLTLLAPLQLSTSRRILLRMMASYLAIAGVLLIVRIAQLIAS